MDLDSGLAFQRKVVEQLRVEMDKRDKILDLLVTGGDVTLVNNQESDGATTGTKTFELLVRKIPYKIETVTLNHINWDELIQSLEKETEAVENLLFSQDIKPKPEPKSKSADVNVDQKVFPLPAKRRLSELDEAATSICESEPVQKQMKLEKKYCEFLSELTEFSMDSSFFETENPSVTTSKSKSKFLIRLHDYNTDTICVYEISNDLKSSSQKSVPVFQLSLQEIQDKINAHKNSNLQIWCDVKDFNIFSDTTRPFFQLYGKSISHFTFSIRFSQENPKLSLLNSNLLIGFILQNFPNLEFLSINSEMLTHLEDLNLNAILNFPPSRKPLKLECLKTLKIVHSNRKQARFSAVFLAKLLKRTPRLESIHGIPLNCIKETAELDKILMEDAIIEDPLIWIGSSIPKLSIRSFFMVREIYYDLNKYSSDLCNLCNLATGNGRMIVALEEFRAQKYFIQDPFFRENINQLMSRILEMNKKSLVKLILEPNPDSHTALTIPRLENLKTLRFEFGRATAYAFFPYGFQVSHTFPKLEKVEMLLAATPQQQQQQQQYAKNPQPDSRISPDFLCRGETFETVQSLTLINFLPRIESGSGSGCLMKIRSMFPNLTRLTLNNNLQDVSRFLQQGFLHFPQLQQLILEIDTDSRHGNLDAALTGINVDLCKKLEKFVPCPMNETGKENLLQIIHSGSSLSDLKELRLLKFVLRSGVAREFNKIPVLTPVSFEYGLGAEGLKKVDIFLDFHTSLEIKSEILTALEIVLPFVTVL